MERARLSTACGRRWPDFAVTLPDRVLLARNGDHPTELMTLRDARLAVMEEFPSLDTSTSNGSRIYTDLVR